MRDCGLGGRACVNESLGNWVDRLRHFINLKMSKPCVKRQTQSIDKSVKQKEDTFFFSRFRYYYYYFLLYLAFLFFLSFPSFSVSRGKFLVERDGDFNRGDVPALLNGIVLIFTNGVVMSVTWEQCGWLWDLLTLVAFTRSWETRESTFSKALNGACLND